MTNKLEEETGTDWKPDLHMFGPRYLATSMIADGDPAAQGRFQKAPLPFREKYDYCVVAREVGGAAEFLGRCRTAFSAVDMDGPYLNVRVSDKLITMMAEASMRLPDPLRRLRGPGLPSVLVEYVSANPTGPLHLGHGRWAAYGGALCRLLEAAGHEVQRQYYLNDGGAQIKKLSASFLCRVRLAMGETREQIGDDWSDDYVGEELDAAAEKFLRTGYHDHYGRIMSQSLVGHEAARQLSQVFTRSYPDAPAPGELSKLLMELMKKELELTGRLSWIVQHFFKQHKKELSDLRAWLPLSGGWARSCEVVSESDLMENQFPWLREQLLNKGVLHLRDDGAVLLRVPGTGEEEDEDRVVVRADGTPTYLAGDVALMHYKLVPANQANDEVIMVLGADHHGYVPRLRALAAAFGEARGKGAPLHVVLGQLVRLQAGDGTAAKMSKRAGTMVKLSEAIEAGGADSLVWHMVSSSPNRELCLSVEQLRLSGMQSPLYYAQYAHARLSSVMERLVSLGIAELSPAAALLAAPSPAARPMLLRALEWPEVAHEAAAAREPHRLTAYATELAGLVHSYYEKEKILDEKIPLEERLARAAHAEVARRALRSCLQIIGVGAPKKMPKEG